MSDVPGNTNDSKAQKHQRAMEKTKQKVDANIAQAQTEQSVVVLLTGNGKGKTSSAFGMVMRALGYGQKVVVIQFIKGEQLSGEELFVKNHLPEVAFHQMGTGFTWDTQNRDSDQAAAVATWQLALAALRDGQYDLVVLDELTYMLAFDYLAEDQIIDAIQQRPAHQSVVITGRGGGSELKAICDTVSEVKDIRHAFNSGIKARKGVDY
ncbi:cob(I)yrinic acid a,c-diamide adenosyltransferase [Halioxenophilus aromaticivorans]|uniref:Corrinoid adenosyltransferase n=1 Tax=Halioxenophilus aromaticivorans TaxID=1306992 RepID=A0AAV3TYI6_9ALTE